tara:strand:+ start:432 stop:635 length:204 start_codon:yes stop_codon:yes gene_type:complete
MINYTPIAVAYKKKYGKKIIVKEFTNVRCPDKLITKRTNLLPKDCEIIQIGVGSKFYNRYSNKYDSV